MEPRAEPATSGPNSWPFNYAAITSHVAQPNGVVLLCRQSNFRLSVGWVPQADGNDLEDRLFAALVLDAKAVAQITGSFSLTWPALVQRNRPTTTGSLMEVQLQ